MTDRPALPKATQRTWVVGYGHLTPDQRQVVELPTRTNHLVCGPAGSGKTLLVLHRARHLLAQGVPPGKLRALVYTRVLRTYIKTGTAALGLPDDVVQTYHQWVDAVAKQLGVRLPRAKDWTERYAIAERTLLQHFEEQKPGPVLDVVLVDEGQDLSADAYRLLARAARHVTVFADEAQRLYAQGIDARQGATALGARREAAVLLRNLRNSEGVSRVAGCFLPPDHAAAYQKAGSYLQKPGQLIVPALYRAPNSAGEWDRLAAVVRREIERNARVAILLPTNSLVGITANQLRRRGIDRVDTVVAWESQNATFNDLTPKVLTVHSAKGLSFDSVLMPCLTGKAWGRMAENARSLLFVGIARGLEWVYLSTTRGQELPELQLLDPLLKSGHIEELKERVVAQPRAGDPGDFEVPL